MSKKYKNDNENGFALLEILIILIVIVIIAGAVFVFLQKKNNNQAKSNNQTGQTRQNQVANKDESALVIHNFGIASFDSVNLTTDATRDFTKSGHKGFYIFGDELPGTPVRHNPNFEFASMKEGTEIISAIDGVVGFIKEQKETNDYEVFLMPRENSNWIIGYDHLTDLKVQKGDKVKIAQKIGSPARQGNGLLRFEFQINKNDNGKDGMHICPSTLLDPSVKDQQLSQLKDIQDKWESISGLELYNPAKQDPVGCILKEMTPTYAQGQ